mmetsp:Transcript_41340/g.131077  ORF Transcript_41340/g.131077 Transcript_41340/m.131077 type:complete len:100 (-) Transcript_41340:110-409(-)
MDPARRVGVSYPAHVYRRHETSGWKCDKCDKVLYSIVNVLGEFADAPCHERRLTTQEAKGEMLRIRVEDQIAEALQKGWHVLDFDAIVPTCVNCHATAA